MFKGNRKYYIILGLCFTVLILVQYNLPKPIDWRPTYSENHRIPYGSYALRRMIEGLFPGKEVSTVEKTIYSVIKEGHQGPCNYFFLNYSLEPDKLDAEILLDFVAKGGNVFAAAYSFGSELADTLKLQSEVKYNDSVQINFSSPFLRAARGYSYPKGVENTIFSSFDTSRTTVLGTNMSGDANFIRIRFGEGNFYLSTLPEVFTNYHFVDKHNCDYVYKALSYLPVENTLWDEYYKPFRNKSQTPMRFILGSPALKTAWFLLITSLVLFIIFGAKRRQRVIPVMEPLHNTTLEFVSIVGTLYYQKGDHKNIAMKKISYFLEHIRAVFFVKTSAFDEAFIKKVSALSGIAKEELRELFNFITVITGSSIIREEEVLKLNSLIEKFHKNSKR